MSPFAKKAKENNFYYIGGKPDDITVIVSQISNRDRLINDSSTNTSTTDNNERIEDYLL